jgi:hypothetical protein
MSKNSRLSSCQRASDETDDADRWRYRTYSDSAIALATSGAVHIRLLAPKLRARATAAAG